MRWVQGLGECIAEGENLQIIGQGHPGHALIEGISKGKPLQIAGPSYSDQALIEEQSKGQVLQSIWKPRGISKVQFSRLWLVTCTSTEVVHLLSLFDWEYTIWKNL